eukprot:TRINITY_DN7972_c0_g2_i1.p3 TRINITY_DN7972_c0_g2~~TRINITY_DN7972_c0_g2_i1.p3  ORF type:complete len:128 (+),score=30.06 TRINITY_DN7972_c0_g2_i1:926-1309(+)
MPKCVRDHPLRFHTYYQYTLVISLCFGLFPHTHTRPHNTRDSHIITGTSRIIKEVGILRIQGDNSPVALPPATTTTTASGDSSSASAGSTAAATAIGYYLFKPQPLITELYNAVHSAMLQKATPLVD